MAPGSPSCLLPAALALTPKPAECRHPASHGHRLRPCGAKPGSDRHPCRALSLLRPDCRIAALVTLGGSIAARAGVGRSALPVLRSSGTRAAPVRRHLQRAPGATRPGSIRRLADALRLAVPPVLVPKVRPLQAGLAMWRRCVSGWPLGSHRVLVGKRRQRPGGLNAAMRSACRGVHLVGNVHEHCHATLAPLLGQCYVRDFHHTVLPNPARFSTPARGLSFLPSACAQSTQVELSRLCLARTNIRTGEYSCEKSRHCTATCARPRSIANRATADARAPQLGELSGMRRTSSACTSESTPDAGPPTSLLRRSQLAVSGSYLHARAASATCSMVSFCIAIIRPLVDVAVSSSQAPRRSGAVPLPIQGALRGGLGASNATRVRSPCMALSTSPATSN